MTIEDLPPAELDHRIRTQGLLICSGPFTFRIQTVFPELGRTVQFMYGDFPLLEMVPLVDFHLRVQSASPYLGRWRRTAALIKDGQNLLVSYPRPAAIALLESGMTRCIESRAHPYLILEGAALVRGKHALLISGPSQSGGNELCAALAYYGWQLVSAEMAVLEPESGHLIAAPRLLCLSITSAENVRRLAPHARFGPVCKDASGGCVQHMRPPTASVRDQLGNLRPAWIVFPKIVAGAKASLQPVSKAQAMLRVAENSFNYRALGARGFKALGQVFEAAECFDLQFGDLESAIRCIDSLRPGQSPTGSTASV